MREEGGRLFEDPMPFTNGTEGADGCPVPSFLTLWAMERSGLPVQVKPDMRAVCLPVLERVLGRDEYERHRCASSESARRWGRRATVAVCSQATRLA